MINANEARTITDASFKERTHPEIEAHWDKIIKGTARARRNSTKQYIGPCTEPYISLTRKVLEENGFNVTIEQHDSTHYSVEVTW